jgi:type II secretory pathway pseudopilin PulG
MKFFSKDELLSVVVIFIVLVAISLPNFSLSLRRARDQTRRDDIGNIQRAIDAYYSDYGIFPLSTPDGKIIACKNSNETNTTATGKVMVDLVPCIWGKDAWINLTPGVSKVYMNTLAGDPNLGKGVSYAYFSDGSRYQLMASLEGKDEPEYDSKLESRGVGCGSATCNLGRANNVPLYITIEEYNLQIYCGQHPKDLKCIKQ